MRVPQALLFTALAACADPKDEDSVPNWAEDTAVAPEANMRLYELDGTGTASADTDAQAMGCIGFETDDTNAQLAMVLATLTSSPSGYLFDRNAALTQDGAEIAAPVDAGMEGDLRFNLSTTVAANGDYELCLTGNTGNLTGDFQYQIASPSDFVLGIGILGSEQDFPVNFTPFSVN